MSTSMFPHYETREVGREEEHGRHQCTRRKHSYNMREREPMQDVTQKRRLSSSNTLNILLSNERNKRSRSGSIDTMCYKPADARIIKPPSVSNENDYCAPGHKDLYSPVKEETQPKARPKLKRQSSLIPIPCKKDGLNMVKLEKELDALDTTTNKRTTTRSSSSSGGAGTEAGWLPDGVLALPAQNDLLYAPHGWKEHIHHLQNKEQRYSLPANYLMRVNITADMRSLMNDWLVQVQRHLGLLPETLHLCVTISDQVVTKLRPKVDTLQLVGITSLLIASKICERYCPEINKLLELTENSYVYDEVIRMEKEILLAMEFDLYIPLVQDYIYYYVTVSALDCDVDKKLMMTMSEYLLDLCLIDVSAAFYRPSHRCAGVVCLLRTLHRYTPNAVPITGVGCRRRSLRHGYVTWSRSLRHYTGYTHLLLQAVMTVVAKRVISAKIKYKGVYHKFSSRSMFDKVSHSDVFDPYNPALIAVAEQRFSAVK